jgi:hypothetical protein
MSLLIALFTFLVAILVTLISQSGINYLSLLPAILILFFIIFIGIISDMIGVAATAAEKSSFNARAAKKVTGAREGLYLVRHANRVSSFMCDIVGDICGTVSGALSVVVFIRIFNNFGGSDLLASLIIIGLVAALTVGGKAFFKTYGIKRADNIIFFVGKALASIRVIKKV